MFFSIPLGKQNEKEEGEGIRVSFRPENFIPGVVIGLIIGLLIDLTKPSKNPSKSILGKPPSKSSSPSGYQDDELKMVLVVRQDLRMGPGKIASQCAHAATGIYAELIQSQRSLLRQWEQCGQPKIVVTCKNQKELNKLQQEAENIGLPTFVVADAGRTQVAAGSKTVLAIGPGDTNYNLYKMHCSWKTCRNCSRMEGAFRIQSTYMMNFSLRKPFLIFFFFIYFLIF